MKPDLNQEPISVANSSGFPLQIATAHAVEQSDDWDVFLEEHPWRSSVIADTGTKGYIDIVAMGRVIPPPRPGKVSWVKERITRDHIALVIECKRVKQTAWVFLIPGIRASDQEKSVSIWHSQCENSKWSEYGWNMSPWSASPASYQSQWCAMPGQEHGRRNLLERTASELIDSVEALAEQEKQIQEKKQTNKFERVYVPIVVTTAQLFVSCFVPSDISLADGSLPKEASTSQVLYLRFRKTLTTHPPSLVVDTVKRLYDESERTVFIVNSSHFPTFLNDFNLPRGI